MKTIELTDQEFETLHWALQDAMVTWRSNIRDCKEGLRPNMSLEGAESIYRDLSTMKTQFQVLSSF
jgi:hypothetical protein